MGQVSRIVALAALAVARIALADPVPVAPSCEAASREEAAVLAARLFDRGEYRHAGLCYQAAGDMSRANLAFMKAVGPQSEETARGLKVQRDAAKTLLAQVGHALHGNGNH